MNLEISEGSRAFSVDDPIRNQHSIEVSYLLDELEVLQKGRTALLRRSEGSRSSFDGMTLVGGHIVWHILCIMSEFVFLSRNWTKDAPGERAANKPSKKIVKSDLI